MKQDRIFFILLVHEESSVTVLEIIASAIPALSTGYRRMLIGMWFMGTCQGTFYVPGMLSICQSYIFLRNVMKCLLLY